MTHSQALQEAKIRWGKDIRIESIFRKKKSGRHQRSDAHTDVEHRVGMIKMHPVLGAIFDVKGIGETWEDAFKNADRVKPVA